MPDLQNLLSPKLRQNATVLQGKICKLKRVILYANNARETAESHWTDTVHPVLGITAIIYLDTLSR